MIYKYKHFISQNIAPSGAKQIGVYDSGGNKVYSIALGGLTPPNKKKLYSFGLVSDIHLWYVEPDWKANTKFDNALSYFENEGCVMCIIAGDLTQTGLYRRTTESDTSTTYLDESQFAKYKEICDNHTIPVYELMGNHESYYSMPIIDNLDKMETYTGKGILSYTVEQGNDLFILLGQPRGGEVMSDEDYEWFENLLSNNQDKRCFIFVHSYIEEDSGDARDFRENSIFDSWSKTSSFINLLNQYDNVILFHGHSHVKFEYQEMDKNANYTDKNGFKSIHIPSLSRPRDIDTSSSTTPYDNNGSQGYLVDVYDDYIILNGIGLTDVTSADVTSKQYQPCPLGTYKIDTPLVTT